MKYEIEQNGQIWDKKGTIVYRDRSDGDYEYCDYAIIEGNGEITFGNEEPRQGGLINKTIEGWLIKDQLESWKRRDPYFYKLIMKEANKCLNPKNNLE